MPTGKFSISGSPPPTRGTRQKYSIFAVRFRITPAYAGNTHSRKSCSYTFWDHPRLRGEHGCQRPFHRVYAGSPPPTRGTLLNACLWAHKAGITPAYAGNTLSGTSNLCLSQDHPRLRGEHATYLGERASLWGSPPPTRGTQ